MTSKTMTGGMFWVSIIYNCDFSVFLKWDVNAFLVSLFDKPATGSIYYGTVQNLDT